MSWVVGLCAVYGKNDHGNLGLGKASSDVIRKPRVLHAFDGLQLRWLAGGKYHCCVVLEDGSLYTWGRDITGTAGRGDEEPNFTSPTLVELPGSVDFVSCGDCHNAAITESGDLFMWGWDIVQSWKDDEECDMTTLTAPTKKEWDGIRPRQVFCGPLCTALVDIHGKLYTWGLGTNGILGHASTSAVLQPHAVSTLAATKINSVAFGKTHALALSMEGEVFAWGAGKRGQLGLGPDMLETLAPVAVPLDFLAPDDRVIGISCGDHHSVLWTRNGLAFSWGASSNYRLGYDAENDVFQPTQIPSLKNVLQISCGAIHNCSVHKDEHSSCFRWGGVNPADFSVSLVTTHCRVAACAKHHTLIHTGRFAHTPSPFFPGFSKEKMAQLEESLDLAEIDLHPDLQHGRLNDLTQFLGRCLFLQEKAEIIAAQAREELAICQQDPLLGAEVNLEIGFLGLRMQGALEHAKDKQYFVNRDRAKKYEETIETEDLTKYLEF